MAKQFGGYAALCKPAAIEWFAKRYRMKAQLTGRAPKRPKRRVARSGVGLSEEERAAGRERAATTLAAKAVTVAQLAAAEAQAEAALVELRQRAARFLPPAMPLLFVSSFGAAGAVCNAAGALVVTAAANANQPAHGGFSRTAVGAFELQRALCDAAPSAPWSLAWYAERFTVRLLSFLLSFSLYVCH